MSEHNGNSIFVKSVSKQQCSDSGMAAVLILLLIGFFTNNIIWYKIAIPVLVVNMTAPIIFKPFAFLWYSLSNLLGAVMSKILLTLVFIIVVVPISIVRKLMGRDALQIKNWKKEHISAMKVRNKKFEPIDLGSPPTAKHNPTQT